MSGGCGSQPSLLVFALLVVLSLTALEGPLPRAVVVPGIFALVTPAAKAHLIQSKTRSWHPGPRGLRSRPMREALWTAAILAVGFADVILVLYVLPLLAR